MSDICHETSPLLRRQISAFGAERQKQDTDTGARLCRKVTRTTILYSSCHRGKDLDACQWWWKGRPHIVPLRRQALGWRRGVVCPGHGRPVI